MSQPVYRSIADHIRERIEAGEFGPDDALPSENELAKERGVNRQTVRQAYNVLVAEGRVVSRSTKGRFVRERGTDVYRPQEEFGRAMSDVMDRFMARLTAENREPSQTIGVEEVNPPRKVAEQLGVAVTQKLLLRRRTRFIKGEPFNINDSFYLPELIAGSEIEKPFDIARGANEVLAELGHRQVRAIDQITARTPTARESERLQLLPDARVMEVLTTGYTADGRAVRCVINVLPADRYEIVFERTRPEDGE